MEMEMARRMPVPLYVALLIAVVVSVDILFFRGRFWERLMANIGIVLVFGAFYLRFWRNPESEAYFAEVP
jgi:Mn2+/Fe2+ NRAMP family transporter